MRITGDKTMPVALVLKTSPDAVAVMWDFCLIAG